MKTEAEKLQYLMDRAEISEVIGRYAYGLDTRNWAMFRSCWADEIEAELPTEDGSTPTTTRKIPADIWVEGSKAFMENIPQSQHLKIPILFDIQGDRATVIALLQGKHWMPNNLGEPLATIVGYYEDKYIRTDAGWKQCGFKETTHWNEGNWHVTGFNNVNFLKVVGNFLA